MLQNPFTRTPAAIGVIGLGYVGLPLAVALAEKYPVVGFDIDADRIAELKSGHDRTLETSAEELAAASGLSFAADEAALKACNVFIVTVPTPIDRYKRPDLTALLSASRTVGRAIAKGGVVIFESTVYPGATEEDCVPVIEQVSGLKFNEDFFAGYSPERANPGDRQHRLSTIVKVTAGSTPQAAQFVDALYAAVVQAGTHLASSIRVAEAAKVIENTQRDLNIALINEMKMVLSAMDIDVWEVVQAAATKPFGFQAFYPGPGLGGHCIPIDPFYLTWKAREVGQPTRFIELAGVINHMMPEWVIQKTMLALNDHGKSVRNARVLVLGLAYKPDVDDVRESPSFELIDQLQKLGAEVDYNDPHVPQSHAMRHYPHMKPMKSVELTPGSLKSYDCVLIATHHAKYDWQLVADNAQLIVDTRNALGKVTGRRDHIVKA